MFTLKPKSKFVSFIPGCAEAKIVTATMSDLVHSSVNSKISSASSLRLPAGDFSYGHKSLGFNGLARKIRRNFQDYGLRITIDKTFAYLLRSIYFRQIYRIYRIDLETTAPRASVSNYNFSFEILTARNVDMISQIENIAEWLRGRLTEAILEGQLCLVALDGKQVAGFNLINFDRATLVLVNMEKELRKGTAWSEHIAVKKEFRKTGLGSELRFRIFEELKERGIRRLYGGTLRSNIASLSLARSVGFKEIGDVHYSKFFSFQKWRYKRVC